MTKPSDKWMQKAEAAFDKPKPDESIMQSVARALEAEYQRGKMDERERLFTEYIDDFIVGVRFVDDLIDSLCDDNAIDISGDEQDKLDTLINLTGRAAAIRKGEQ